MKVSVVGYASVYAKVRYIHRKWIESTRNRETFHCTFDNYWPL